MLKTIPQPVIAAVNALLAPYGRVFTESATEPVELLPPDDARKMLGGISKSTLYRLVADGKIKRVRITEGRYVFPLTEIKRYIKEHSQYV